MNKKELNFAIAEKTGFDLEIVERVMKAFEKTASESLPKKAKGDKNNSAVVRGTAEKAEVSKDVAEKILDAFEDVFSEQLSNLLKQ